MRLRSWPAAIACCLATCRGIAEDPLPRVPPTEPARAVETLQLQDGFRAELIAAEPLVTDPVAIAYDEYGLAYVVEMNDYPYSDPSHDRAWQEQTSEPLGRVRVLEDIDGDGRYDRSTVFADGLSWPSGIALWQGGVYVAATPDVWHLKDTDGDRRADVRRKVFTGFRKYNVQAVMNNLHWGLDHRLYGAGSSNGGSIQSAGATDEAATALGRNDFRFDPRTERLEIVSGGARFGQGIDDWGERFLCNIRNPVQHVVLPAEALRRNRHLAVSAVLQDVVDSGDSVQVYPVSPPEPWRVIHAQRLAADPSSTAPHDSTVPAGFVTSSSGVTIYRGAAWPREYRGNAFVGEVAGNLVMRYRLEPDGVTFRGARVHAATEFLASTDNWFRPVNFANAPDGTLHVLDMYRETIEHPWSMPDDLKTRVDLTSGRDQGRIYRLLPAVPPADFTPPPPPRLGAATTQQLVAELENPNGWWRDTAHRLLFERQDQSAVPLLKLLLRESGISVARVHALWSLEGLASLAEDDLAAALRDDDPHVREHAVRLAESRLTANPALLNTVLALAADDDPRVRFQVALTLGEVRDARTSAALVSIARRDAADPWTRVALLTSLGNNGGTFLHDLLSDARFVESAGGRGLCAALAQVVAAAGGKDSARAALDDLAQLDVAAEAHSGILRGLGTGLLRARTNLAALLDPAGTPGERLAARLLNEAAAIAIDSQAELAPRLSAIELLGYSSYAIAGPRLVGLLGASQPPEVQTAAITALTRFPEPSLAKTLLERYRSLTPSVQQQLVDGLLSRQDWVAPVFAAIEQGTVAVGRISPARRTVYLQSSRAEIREQAARLFAADRPGPRKDVIDRYRPALSLAGDPERGQAVFRRECGNCHRLGALGHDVGPNLATIRNRSPEELLTQVLDPNREVSPNYLQYIAVTTAGEVHTGVIASETPHSVTLRAAEGKERSLLRSEIEELRSAGQSLMPEGMELKITPQEMADLIAYLLTQRQ